jgi:glycerol-3-phosphate cytidylyltransferase
MITGFACGVFDLFHGGHVRMLMDCKKHCDRLVIAVNAAENIDSKINPGKKPPIYSLEDRVLILRSSRYVDDVVVYHNEAELLELMKNDKFDVRFLGEDYKGKPITGAELNIRIEYIDRGHGLSTSFFRKKIIESGGA